MRQSKEQVIKSLQKSTNASPITESLSYESQRGLINAYFALHCHFFNSILFWEGKGSDPWIDTSTVHTNTQFTESPTQVGVAVHSF